jgi:hippurate hydrolase
VRKTWQVVSDNVPSNTGPLKSAVLSITQFHAGSAGNVIPDAAVLNGTVRTLDPDVRDEMERIMRETAEATAATYGATASLDYERGYPSVVNAPEPTRRAARAAERLLGAGKVITDAPPTMGGEDFSYMAQAVPGCFVRIGQRDGDKGAVPLHNARYDFNDDILPVGASFWAGLVEQELPRE